MVMHHSAGAGGARPLGLSSLARPAQRALDAAGAAFQRHPFLIKTVSSAFGFAFGDVLFQLGTTARPRRRRAAAADHPPAAAHPPPNALVEALHAVDWRRAGAMGGAGLVLAGPLGYALIMWMEGNLFTAAPHRCVAPPAGACGNCAGTPTPWCVLRAEKGSHAGSHRL